MTKAEWAKARRIAQWSLFMLPPEFRRSDRWAIMRSIVRQMRDFDDRAQAAVEGRATP